MRYKAEIMTLDEKSNTNGRIYNKDSIDTILNTWKEHNIVLSPLDVEDKLAPDNIWGSVEDVYKEDNKLIAVYNIFDNFGENLKYGKFYGATYGEGNVNSKGVVEDYEFLGFEIVNDSSFDVNPLELLEN